MVVAAGEGRVIACAASRANHTLTFGGGTTQTLHAPISPPRSKQPNAQPPAHPQNLDQFKWREFCMGMVSAGGAGRLRIWMHGLCVRVAAPCAARLARYPTPASRAFTHFLNPTPPAPSTPGLHLHPAGLPLPGHALHKAPGLASRHRPHLGVRAVHLAHEHLWVGEH